MSTGQEFADLASERMPALPVRPPASRRPRPGRGLVPGRRASTAAGWPALRSGFPTGPGLVRLVDDGGLVRPPVVVPPYS